MKPAENTFALQYGLILKQCLVTRLHLELVSLSRSAEVHYYGELCDGHDYCLDGTRCLNNGTCENDDETDEGFTCTCTGMCVCVCMICHF